MFALLPTPHPPLDPSTLQTISPTQYAYSLPSSLSFSHIVIFILPGQSLPPDTVAGIYIRFPSPAGQPEKEFKLLGGLGEGKASAIFKVDAKSRDEGKQGIGGGARNDGDKIVGEVNGVKEVDMDADENTDTGLGGAGVLAVDGAVTGVTPKGEIVVGISIEPVATLGPQLAALAQAKSASSSAALSSSTTAQMTLTPNAAGALTLSRSPAQANSMSANTADRGGGGGSSGIPTKILAQKIIKNAFNFLASFAGNTAGGQEVVPLKSFEDWWRKFETRVENDPGFLEREGD